MRSLTAQSVARHRAVHQLLDAPPVFDHPLAVPIVGWDEALAAAARAPASAAPARLRAFVAARSRFAEDTLAAAVARGVRQYVVLGAGLDTFACRNPFPDLRVFEVDEPETQRWKAGRIAAAGIAWPASATMVAVDFERETVGAGLARTRFASGEPAFFSWLGVTPYLARETVLATLGFVGALPASSAVVFDYGLPRELLATERERAAFDALSARVAMVGEPFLSFFDPRSLAGDIAAAGFATIEDLSPEDINLRYFSGRPDGLRVGSLARLMHAKV